MPGKIYLIGSDKSLQALSQQPYPDEDDFQTLLEQYPDLLAGDQMDEAGRLTWRGTTWGGVAARRALARAEADLARQAERCAFWFSQWQAD